MRDAAFWTFFDYIKLLMMGCSANECIFDPLRISICYVARLSAPSWAGNTQVLTCSPPLSMHFCIFVPAQKSLLAYYVTKTNSKCCLLCTTILDTSALLGLVFTNVLAKRYSEFQVIFSCNGYYFSTYAFHVISFIFHCTTAAAI